MDTKGRVYSFGQGSGGQLGQPSSSFVSTPSNTEHVFDILPPRVNGSGLGVECVSSVDVVPLAGTSVDPPDEPMDVDDEGEAHTVYHICWVLFSFFSLRRAPKPKINARKSL